MVAKEIAFTIRFHTPFRVGAAYAEDGLDAVVDRDDPLPADHLKGLMRAEATKLLKGTSGEHLVRDVFGSVEAPAAWAWTSAAPSGAWSSPTQRHRVKIDKASHTATRHHLVMTNVVFVDSATFTVEKMNPSITAAKHESLIRLSGRLVQHLGAWRRRGLGWVQVGVADDPLDPEALRGVIRREFAELPRNSLGSGVA